MLILIFGLTTLLFIVAAMRRAPVEIMMLLGVSVGGLSFGVLHVVAAMNVVKLHRWAMQMARTLSWTWVIVGVAMCLAFLVEPALILLAIPAVLLIWFSFGGVSLSKLAIQRLNEDDGFSTDEPPRPKGFEPVLIQPTEPSADRPANH